MSGSCTGISGTTGERNLLCHGSSMWLFWASSPLGICEDVWELAVSPLCWFPCGCILRNGSLRKRIFIFDWCVISAHFGYILRCLRILILYTGLGNYYLLCLELISSLNSSNVLWCIESHCYPLLRGTQEPLTVSGCVLVPPVQPAFIPFSDSSNHSSSFKYLSTSA